MHSPDLTQANIDKIAELFPTVVTERLVCPVVEPIEATAHTHSRDCYAKAIDFDLLRQELSDHVVEGPQERYQLDWPGKREALFAANAPIAKTLRPVREESVDFDTTKNIFIEGDNLDALKLLQESYLGKVKLIYIDPPYNTGSDRFVYPDNYAETNVEYLKRSGQNNDTGAQLHTNSESIGRFHSLWLSMMMPRLRLARDLLSESGVILVSIDAHEVHQLRSLCDEIFGASSFKNVIAVRRGIKNVQAQFDDVSALAQGHEYILMYARSGMMRLPKLSMTHSQGRPGKWDTFWRGTDRPTMRYELFGIRPTSGQWRWEESRTATAVANYERFLASGTSLTLDEHYIDHLMSTNVKLNFVRLNDEGSVQYYVPPSEGKLLSDNWMDVTLAGSETGEFDTEKNVELVRRAVGWLTSDDDIVLDFFAGSGTTGHAVIAQNAADGGARRFALVQVAEPIQHGSSSESVAEVARRRLRTSAAEVRTTAGLDAECLDVGFRVFRVESTNMADLLRTPDEQEQETLALSTDSIKPCRTAEDLLFQVLLDWGLPIDLPIERVTIAGAEVFDVDEGTLVACFDSTLTVDVIRAIAERAPVGVAVRDSAFADDAARINAEQVFREVSPDTIFKAI